MRYGICTGSDNLLPALTAGYDFVELGMSELMPSQDDSVFTPVRLALLASPIPLEACNCFLPAALKVVGANVDLAAVRDYMATALRRAAEVGISVVVFGSGGARSIPDGFPPATALQQLSDAVHLAADIAASFGITIAIEPLGTECNLINTSFEGEKFIEQLGHPHAQLLVDIYHMSCQNESFAPLRTLASHLVHVHLDSFHLPPLSGGRDYDAPAFFTALACGGYQGRFSLEDHSNFVNNTENKLTFTEAASKQLAIIKAHWEAAQNNNGTS